VPEDCRGFPQYYDEILDEYWQTTFYQFKDDAIYNFEPGQVCFAFICYEKCKTYFLEPFSVNPFDEDNTHWRLIQANTRQPFRSERLQGYNLETNEFPIVKVAKLRLVVLLRKISTDWFVPGNQQVERETWLVLPLFTYKARHNQKYILEDQRLNTFNRFYFPPSTLSTALRISKESAGHLHLIQTVNQENLKPISALSKKHRMQKGIKVSPLILKLVTYHYFSNLRIIDDIFFQNMDMQDDYQIFKMVVNELIDESIKI